MSDDEDHDELVAALQDVMLPAGIPVLPSVDLAARYCLPGGAEEAIGNWFDVVTLSNGRLGLVVGEAVGTGMAAAAAMGQVRAVLRAGLQVHEDVLAALRLADVFAAGSEDARGAAVVVAVLDPQAGTVVHATAGHPAPVIAGGDHDPVVRGLESKPAGWLGTGSHYASTESSIARGEMLLLACSASQRSVDSVSSTVAAQYVAGDPERTCDQLAQSMFTMADEALTLLAAEVRLEPRHGFTLDLPTGDTAKRAGRERLAGWLEEIDAPPMDAMAIVHASAELVANAVEHAKAGHHAESDGTTRIGGALHVQVQAELTADGEVEVGVLDQGTWREPADDDDSRGRGLAMAAGLVDAMRIEPGPDGTRAVIRHRLSRPVHIDRSPNGVVPLPVRSVTVSRPAPGSVSLLGSFGHDDVDRVSAELLLASRGGTRSVRVDLEQVTHLASTAVRMLGDLVADATSAPVLLVAPPGSPAERALDVACIPHDAA